MVGSAFHLGWSTAWYVLPLFFAAVGAVWLIFRRVRRSANELVHVRNRGKLLIGFSRLRGTLKAVAFTVALVALFIALLRPQWGRVEQRASREGRDVVLVLDVSRSMLAKDLKPSRLDVAKRKARVLMERLVAERVGLVLFAGTAFVACPLTADQAACAIFLRSIDAQYISSGTTALDEALLRVKELFGETVAQPQNKAIIILTDGEDFSSNLSGAKEWLARNRIPVFALGVATSQGAPIPIINEHGEVTGYEKNEQGIPLKSVLNEPLLSSIAQELGGLFMQATLDDSDIDAIVARIELLKKEQGEEREVILFEERYPWFIGVAWLLLALEWIL